VGDNNGSEVDIGTGIGLLMMIRAGIRDSICGSRSRLL
jgi:hypothetical protein